MTILARGGGGDADDEEEEEKEDCACARRCVYVRLGAVLLVQMGVYL